MGEAQRQIEVLLNGEKTSISCLASTSMREVLDLLNKLLPAGHVLDRVLLNQRAITEDEWQQAQDGRVEAFSTEKVLHLTQRLPTAERYLLQIISEFSGARRSLAEVNAGAKNEQEIATQQLGAAVDNLLAFLHWYHALLSLESSRFAQQLERFFHIVDDVQSVCDVLIEPEIVEVPHSVALVLRQRFEPLLKELLQNSREACAVLGEIR